MANRLERVADLTVIPGTPAQPEVPETCVLVQVGTRREIVTVTQDQITSPTYSDVTQLDHIQPGAIDYSTVVYNYGTPPPNVFGDDYTVVRTVPVYEQECTGGTPFVPGTPTQVIEGAGPDWLSYARSQPVVEASGGFNFTVGGPAIVGLMEPVIDGQYGLGVIDYGLYFDGAEVFPVLGGAVGASLGAYTGEISVTVERQSGRYLLSVGGVVVDTANITQDTSAALVAFLQTDEAYVVDPEVFQYTTTTASGETSLSLLSATAQQLTISAVASLPLSAYALALVDGEMQALASATLGLSARSQPTVTEIVGAEARLPLSSQATTQSADGGQIRGTPMELLAFDHPYTSVELVPRGQTLTAASTGGAPVQAITRVSLGATKPIVSTYVLAGAVLGAEMTSPKPTVRASEGEYASVEAVAPRQIMGAALTTGEPLTVAYTERVYSMSGYLLSRVAVVHLDFGSLLGTSDAVLSVAIPETLNESLSIGTDCTATQLLAALIESQVRVFMAASPPGRADAQYLVTAVNGALSRATGLDFSQFVYGNGVTHGVRKDGLYRVGGYADDRVDAEADFGSSTFGTSAAKNIETAYVGLKTDGSVYLGLVADGKERIYKVIQREPTMRARVGKGLTARTWGIRLVITGMTRADLDDMELVVGSSRRWTR